MWDVDTQDERAIVGRFDDLVGVAVLYGALDEAFFDRLGGTLETLASREGPVSALVVRAGAAPGTMPAHVRAKAKRVLGGYADRLRGVAYVLGGSGLKAKMVRTAMNAVLLGSSFDAKTFTDVEGAVRWLAGLRGQPEALTAHEQELLRTVRGLL